MALKLCHRIKISIKKTNTQNKPYSFSLLHIILAVFAQQKVSEEAVQMHV